MILHSRAQIRLDTSKDCMEFVRILNSDGTANKYILENYDGDFRVDARSLLGVLYASSEFGDYIYLVNETEDGTIPSFIDKFRV